jgi:Spy/CpxP family protein refolding chaperone
VNGPRTPRRTRLLAIGVLAATFATGMLAGTAADQALAARGPAPAPKAGWQCEGGPGGKTRAILDQLRLTPEQRTRIDAVMERRRAQADAFWASEGPRMRSIVDSTRAEVRAILTPEQRAEYDRIREQHRAARRAAKEAQKQSARAGER